ncbi:MAG: DUF3795 domain-containing protein [Syntrophobacterales bacterium]|jgi:hypothetical protein
MKESYCGCCDTCPLDNPDFLEALTQVKKYVKEFPIFWWTHCFPGDEGFSFPEFIKGLDWFLSHTECPGCKKGGGLKECPIRQCARQRQVAHCSECSDVEICDHYNIIIQEYPGNRVYLNRYLLRVGLMMDSE